MRMLLLTLPVIPPTPQPQGEWVKCAKKYCRHPAETRASPQTHRLSIVT
jgi:hypothetical protein